MAKVISRKDSSKRNRYRAVGPRNGESPMPRQAPSSVVHFSLRPARCAALLRRERDRGATAFATYAGFLVRG